MCIRDSSGTAKTLRAVRTGKRGLCEKADSAIHGCNGQRGGLWLWLAPYHDQYAAAPLSLIHILYRDSVQAWLPIKNIIGGVVITKDNRFVKIMEVLPVNIYLKSAIDRQNIISSFASYLQIAPDELQMIARTLPADTQAYVCLLYTSYDQKMLQILHTYYDSDVGYGRDDRISLCRRLFVDLSLIHI